MERMHIDARLLPGTPGTPSVARTLSVPTDSSWAAATLGLAQAWAEVSTWHLPGLGSKLLKWRGNAVSRAQLLEFYWSLQHELAVSGVSALELTLDQMCASSHLNVTWKRVLSHHRAGQMPVPAWAIEELPAHPGDGCVLLMLGSLPSRLRVLAQPGDSPGAGPTEGETQLRLEQPKPSWEAVVGPAELRAARPVRTTTNTAPSGRAGELGRAAAREVLRVQSYELRGQALQALVYLEFSGVPDRDQRLALIAQAMTERTGIRSQVRAKTAHDAGFSAWAQPRKKGGVKD